MMFFPGLGFCSLQCFCMEAFITCLSTCMCWRCLAASWNRGLGQKGLSCFIFHRGCWLHFCPAFLCKGIGGKRGDLWSDRRFDNNYARAPTPVFLPYTYSFMAFRNNQIGRAHVLTP